MKIPTLLALTILSAVIVLGVSNYIFRERENFQLEKNLDLKKIQVVNVQDTSVSVIWQSTRPTQSIIVYGTNNLDLVQSNDLDKEQTSHLVNLTNLTPNTSYKFKIKVGDNLYPQKEIEFKTGPVLEKDPVLFPPIRGSILNENFEPVQKALVVLKIAGAQDVATITTQAGNFVLPLVNIRSADLKAYTSLQNKEGKLHLIKNNKNSEIIITVPVTEPLPPLLINQNLDLRSYIASSSAQIVPFKEVIVEKGSPLSKFDLNRDGKINAIDFSIIIDSFGKNPKDRNLLQRYQNIDFNNDEKIDQRDIDAIKRALLI